MSVKLKNKSIFVERNPYSVVQNHNTLSKYASKGVVIRSTRFTTVGVSRLSEGYAPLALHNILFNAKPKQK